MDVVVVLTGVLGEPGGEGRDGDSKEPPPSLLLLLIEPVVVVVVVVATEAWS